MEKLSQRLSNLSPGSKRLPVVLTAGVLGLMVAVAPVTIDLVKITLTESSALAMGGGGGHGGGNGNGVGNNDSGDDDGGDGYADAGGNGNGFANAGGNNNGHGNAGSNGNGNGNGNGNAGGTGNFFANLFGGSKERGAAESDVDPDSTGFVNHGARVRTMVALAKELGYSASVGAMQVNFGTPQENGITALQDAATALEADLAATEADLNAIDIAALADAVTAAEAALATVLADPAATQDDIDTANQNITDAQAAVTASETQATDLAARIGELESAIVTTQDDLAVAIEEAKPGDGPLNGWETANLDVNGDGSVDSTDLTEAIGAADDGDLTPEGDELGDGAV